MANMHKKQRRQDRDGLARWCSDIAPLGRYSNEPYIVEEVPCTYKSFFSMVVDIVRAQLIG